MRMTFVAAAAGAALLCLAPWGAAAATAHPSATTTPATPATQRIVVRPVTPSGHAAPGYTVKKVSDADPIDCSYPSASVAAVDDDILQCSPDAAYPVACWRAAKAHHVLCFDSAFTRRLVRFRTSGKIAHTTPLHRRAPLTLLLADGTKCGLRDGGAAVGLRQHPTWAITYYCSQGSAVWAPESSKNFGVHRSGHAWTVKVAADSGKKDVHTVRVTKAYFVGTA